jgi:tripartite-type tricarboxylate transporter receptor subunit TctC
MALAAAPHASAAQPASHATEYPNKPIRLLVQAPPGGAADGIARILADGFSRDFGKPVVIDNRGGGGGIVAAELTARAPPDGYTLLLALAAFTTAPFLQANLSYDPLKDFATITEVANQPLLLAVNLSVPVSSVKELIALAKSGAGLTAGCTQVGSATHLATELFKLKTGTTKGIVSVNYKGGPAAQIALVSGEVQLAFATSTSALPQIRSGKIKVIATAAAKRLAYLPDVPTLLEAGVAGVDSAPWTGLLAPARTSRTIINVLHAKVVQLLKLPETLERLVVLGSDPVGSTPEVFAAKIRHDLGATGVIVKAIGLKPR